jgi:anti-sigma B factor antagonist
LTIETTVHGKTAVIAPNGRMDADSASLFETECERAVSQGADHLIVDLTRLNYVSSMGLRSFLRVAKTRREEKGGLAIVNLNGFVKQVFDVTQLTPLFHVYETVDQALQAMP